MTRENSRLVAEEKSKVRTDRSSRRLFVFCGSAVLALIALGTGAQTPRVELPPAQVVGEVRQYIKAAWSTLSRSNRDLLKAAPDPKMPRRPGERWPVYVSPKEDRQRVAAELRGQVGDEGFRTIDLRTLPVGANRDGGADLRTLSLPPSDHGLLYLPRPYVVPGGRFNEMYGWDSYFIQVGLLRDGEVERARDLVENFLYEVEQYGTILNANRTYFLTRSQPPFLTRMILSVFERIGDRAWLRSTLPAIKRYYTFWTTAPHLIPETGLSRYFDFGEGPAPEVVSAERDSSGLSHYDRVREFFRTHRVEDYDLAQYYDRGLDRLTGLFFKGDRSMRESGFDPSNRFGPFSVDIIHYAPVCLNALLYQMEIDAAEIRRILGSPELARIWTEKANRRRQHINRFLWDEQAGLYFDYHVRDKRRRPYEFATTFYPLWAGLATPEQAARVRGNLTRFEAAGGLLTSTSTTGSQWDAPYGWAPLQMIAVEGLRRYGYDEDADRIAVKFIALIAKEFQEHGTIVEKYDVSRRESDISAGLRFGYTSNEVGFGWTNAAFVDLLARLKVKEPAVAR